MQFLNENVWLSIEISLKIAPEGLANNNSNIDSRNGLVTIRWQAIIWTNDD